MILVFRDFDYDNNPIVDIDNEMIIDDDFSKLNALVKKVYDEEKRDVTIVMAHANPVLVSEALSSEDVDLVTGGHDHAGRYGVSSTGVYYIQADYYGKGYASATIIIDSEGNVITEYTAPDVESVRRIMNK